MSMSCRITLQLLFFFSVAISQYRADSSPSPQPYRAPGNCPAGYFFKTSTLTCTRCPINQTVSEDSLSCQCLPGYYKEAGSGVTNFSCQECPGRSFVTSRDGLFCLECEGGAIFDPTSMECTGCSASTEIYVDTLPQRRLVTVGIRSCASCPQGSWSDDLGFSCVECGIPDCTQCNMVQGVCLSPSSESLPSPPTDSFQFYDQHFTAATEQCAVSSNATACQLVANLCVLQNYLRSDPACVQSILLTPEGLLPPLYYPERGAQVVLEETRVRARLLTTEGEKGVTSLPLVLVSFSLNGTFLGLEEILMQQIFLCKDRPSRAQSAWRVGVQYQIQCSLSVSELTRQASSPVLYDLFFLQEGKVGSNSSELLPIPVLVTNYRSSSQEGANMGEDVGRWQLVRRFYLAESVTTHPQYVENMHLIVEVTSGGGIALPYLRLTYASWTPSATSSQTLPSFFRTTYRQLLKSLLVGITITASILTVGAMAYAGIKTNGFLRRSGAYVCMLQMRMFLTYAQSHAAWIGRTLSTWVYLVVELSAACSSIFFILLTITAVIWLIFFKAQSVLFFVLPTDQQELVFEIYLGLALLFRVIHVSYLIWHQCTIDIFFMDWERPRGFLLSPNPTSASGGVPPTPPVAVPVSIWRTYFVAGEWSKLQSFRKINHTLLLFLVLLFQEVVGFGHLAERDPESKVTVTIDRYSAPSSYILRFGTTSLLFLIIAFVMRLYLFLIYERFVENKIRRFMDFCSVSNISLFLMSHKLFGYYIHGRSVHGHADTNMREMDANLLKEQEGMCAERGLECGSDIQTFEISLTLQFRTQYDKILAPLRARSAEWGRGAGAEGYPRQRSRGQERGMSEVVLRAYETMNHFLTSFFDRNIQGLDFSINDKLLAERVLGMELHDTESNSISFRDRRYSFDQVLFCGHFWALFQLDLLMFSVVDCLAQNYILAAFITYIVTWVIDILRDALGIRNLARKTLVDNRFQ